MNSAVRAALGRYAVFSHRRPWLVLALGLVVAALSALVASHLGFKGDFAELLPESSREVRDLRKVEALAGGGGYLVVQVTGGTREARRTLAEVYSNALMKRPDLVRYVEWKFDAAFFSKRALWLMPMEDLHRLTQDVRARVDYEKRAANPLYVELDPDNIPASFDALHQRYSQKAPVSEYLEARDGSELYLYVKPSQSVADLGFAERLVAQADVIAHEVLASSPAFEGLAVASTGAYVGRIEEDGMLKRDATLAAALSLLFTCGLILVGTRRPAALVVVALPVCLGIVVTLAVAYLLVGHLNPVTSFLAAILIGLGIEYGVHLSMRYWEERRALEPAQALAVTLEGTLAGAATSAVTNAAAFGVLVFAEFAAFRQFGVIAAAGVLVTVVASYALAPAILSLAERLRPARKTAPVDAGQVVRAPPFSPSLTLAVIGPVVGFAIWSATVAPRVGFETDLAKLHGETPSWKLDGHITEQMGIYMTPAVVAVKSLEAAERVTALARAQMEQAGESRTFERVASLSDFVPQGLEPRQAALAELRALLDGLPNSLKDGPRGDELRRADEMVNAQPWVAAEVPLEVRRRFTPLSGTGTFVLIFPRYSGTDMEQLKAWSDQLDALSVAAEREGLEAPILDGNRIAGRVFTLIRTDGPRIVLGAALVVFLLIWVSLRKLSHALLVVGPLYLGFLCLVGALELFGLKLNIFNSVVLPSLLAIAVDNSVHLFHRYEEEGPGSLRHVLRETGYASVLATLSNAAGYVAMLAAGHEGLRSVGTLAVLGVGCTFVGTTIVFPLVLSLRERSAARRPLNS